MNIAISTPVTTLPASSPPRAAGPSRKPTSRGATMAIAPGRIISFSAEVAAMDTQVR